MARDMPTCPDNYHLDGPNKEGMWTEDDTRHTTTAKCFPDHGSD